MPHRNGLAHTVAASVQLLGLHAAAHAQHLRTRPLLTRTDRFARVKQEFNIVHTQDLLPRLLFEGCSLGIDAACGLEDEAGGHGFLDDLRLSCELAVTRVFDAVARVARRLVWMPDPDAGVPRAPSPPREPSLRGGRRRSASAVPDGPSVSFTRPTRCAWGAQTDGIQGQYV